jgi:hypothetical protein
MSHRHFNPAPLVLAAACIAGMPTAHAATVAWYRFENGVAGQTAVGKGSIVDSSGNGLDASPWGDPVYEAVSNPGSTLALRFDGKDAHVSVPDNPMFQLTHSLTLEAYVYLRDGACGRAAGVIVRSDSRYDFDPYYLDIGPGCIPSFLIEQHAGVGSLLQSPDALPIGQWVHVAGTLDDGTGTQALYINGAMVASRITPYRPFANLKNKDHPVVIFGWGTKGSPDRGRPLLGSIDEIRISDVALDPSQFLPPP